MVSPSVNIHYFRQTSHKQRVTHTVWTTQSFFPLVRTFLQLLSSFWDFYSTMSEPTLCFSGRKYWTRDSARDASGSKKPPKLYRWVLTGIPGGVNDRFVENVQFVIEW